jgi:quercetin dioxygenase-like cupin family protein
MCGAGCDRVIQCRAIAAEHRDGRPRPRQRGRDLAANASAAAGDERMWRLRQSGHARASPNEFVSVRLAYILDFKLLQETASAATRTVTLDRSGAAGSVALTSRRTGIMAALEKGITRNGTGYSGKTWNILGQVYFPKAVTDSTFAFETNSDPGQFVPVHIHPTQDEFILVQDGMLDLKLDGVWVKANAGDLVRLPRGIPHGYFNKSDKPARALFWVSPTQKLEALFNRLHNLTDVAEIVRISAEHEVNFLPPEANE